MPANRWAAVLVGMGVALAIALGVIVYLGPGEAGNGTIAGVLGNGPSGQRLAVRHGCADCHALSDNGNEALAPSLSRAVERAESRLGSPAYSGDAESADEYLLESIVDHCEHVVDGYSCDEVPEYGLLIGLDEAAALTDWIRGLQ